MPRLAIVSVHYYGHWSRAALDTLHRIVGSTGVDHCILVNNQTAMQDELLGLAARHAFVNEVLVHDNCGSEFGAYQLGLERARQAGDFDWLLFLNDSLSTHQPFCRSHRKELAARLRQPPRADMAMAIGRVEALPRTFVIAGARTHRWITTNLFALNRRSVAMLGGRVHHPELDALVRDTGDPDDFFADGVDETLASHLKAWLFGAQPGPRWRSAAALTADNAPGFARKARAILQEKYLSALLEEGSAFFRDLRQTDRLGRALCRGEYMLFDLRRRLVEPNLGRSR